MKHDMRPTLKPAEVGKATPEIPPPMPAPMPVAKQTEPRPRYWEFVPERNADNLITRVIATPIY